HHTGTIYGQKHMHRNSNPNQTEAPGATTSYNGTVTGINGYNSSVHVTCQGATPQTIQCPPLDLVPTAGGSPFSFSASNATPQRFNFSVQGVGSDTNQIQRTQAVSLNATEVALSTPNPTSVSAVQGK